MADTSARDVLSGHLSATRLVRADFLSAAARTDVYLKLEIDQPTGSFKVRGALYALASRMARDRVESVVAASTGNHGAAVAYAARQFSVPATIFVPVGSNPVKLARIRALGGRVVETGALLSEAIDAAAAFAADNAAYFLHDASDPDVPIGAGTIAAEVIEQLPETSAIYVPVGDTALIRGVATVAKQLKPGIRIVGVQTAEAPAYYRSWQSGAVVISLTANTIADGLATSRPLAPNVAAIRSLVDDMRLVSEEQLLEAVVWLMTKEAMVVEPSGAATTAALLAEGPTQRSAPTSDSVGAGLRARPVVLLVTGANIAPEVLKAAMRRARE